MENGSSVTVASRNMIVKPASRMLSAISFGVFCRFAPSTMAIIRSRNVSPASDVMRTTSQSDRTRLPPVAAQLARLRSTAAFSHRLGEVGEEHGEPEPEGDGKDEPRRRLALPAERLQEETRREHTADLDDKHHRVLDLVPRIKLPEG